MPPALASPARDTVIFLHGLARTGRAFLLAEQVFRAAGYHTHAPDYPSTRARIDTLLDHVDTAVAAAGRGHVHFVTHSLGGILVRAWLEKRRPNLHGRIVMLAPPNRGTEVIDRFGHWRVLRSVAGPVADELGTRPESVPNQLGPVRGEVGVIAGTLSVNPVFSAVISGRDDGCVGVEQTRVAGMRDHIVIPATHSFLMNNPLVLAQTLVFLRSGHLLHGLPSGEVLAHAWRLHAAQG